VASVAVVAAPDEVLGQRPVACVVPAGPWPADQLEQDHLEELLHKACEAALPRPKRPSEFCLVPELPVGPTGKVSRRRLREMAGCRVCGKNT
jgi:acyl-CoA synthetase (AMP-forming)/AMP-acid ligase II